MKVAGIIAEYNPFHKGHEYHIAKTRELTGADYVIVIMSGDFVQRGEPAIYNKYLRTRMALLGGADLVIELPVQYALASAGIFAQGAVEILNNINCIDFLSFGSECGKIDELFNIASLLADETPQYKALLTQKLKDGNTFPQARQYAINELLADKNDDSSPLLSPNNALAIEYITSILKSRSRIMPFTIKRDGSGYNEQVLPSNSGFASALSIRKKLLDNIQNSDDAFLAMPDYAKDIIKKYSPLSHAPIDKEDFSSLIQYKILSAANSLEKYSDISLELANRIRSSINSYNSLNDYCELLKTKNVTYSHISRVLFHLLLDITNDLYDSFTDSCSYAAILGFKKQSSELLAEIKKRGNIKLISKNANAKKILSSHAFKAFEISMFSSQIYEMISHYKNNSMQQNPYTASPIIL